MALVAARVPRDVLEATYGMTIIKYAFGAEHP
jgi:hypothetical protein